MDLCNACDPRAAGSGSKEFAPTAISGRLPGRRQSSVLFLASLAGVLGLVLAVPVVGAADEPRAPAPAPRSSAAPSEPYGIGAGWMWSGTAQGLRQGGTV